jgi:hypothetical protein
MIENVKPWLYLLSWVASLFPSQMCSNLYTRLRHNDSRTDFYALHSANLLYISYIVCDNLSHTSSTYQH